MDTGIAVTGVEPARRVGWRFLLVYALAYTGTWIALLTPVVITISLKIRELTPGVRFVSLLRRLLTHI